MENSRNINIDLKETTIKRIEEWLVYCNMYNKNADYDLPQSVEEFVKASLFNQLNSLEKIYEISVSEGELKNRFKEIMKKKGLKQSELAKKCKIDQGSMSRILKNEYQPHLDIFIRIWTSLDCPPIELVLYRD